MRWIALLTDDIGLPRRGQYVNVEKGLPTTMLPQPISRDRRNGLPRIERADLALLVEDDPRLRIRLVGIVSRRPRTSMAARWAFWRSRLFPVRAARRRLAH